MKKLILSVYTFFCVAMLFQSCIKDDIIDDRVDPVLRITNKLDSIGIDSTFTLKALYLDEVGKEKSVTVNWTSSDENVLTVNSLGRVKGLKQGTAWVKVNYLEESFIVEDSNKIVVDTVINSQMTNEEREGTVQTTSSYPLSGSYKITQKNGGLELSLGADYTADNSLPGLYIYLSNNNSTTANALEIGAVTVFEGAHSYFIPNVGINQYSYILYFCKPFNVKVGDGLIN